MNIPNAHVTCTDAPSVRVGPSDTTILSNATLSLVCDLDGAPFPDVTWTKDGETFNFTERVYTRMYSASLQFDSLELSDSGVYQCFAANMDGSVESNNATLLVLGGSSCTAAFRHQVCVELCSVYYTQCPLVFLMIF